MAVTAVLFATGCLGLEATLRVVGWSRRPALEGFRLHPGSLIAGAGVLALLAIGAAEFAASPVRLTTVSLLVVGSLAFALGCGCRNYSLIPRRRPMPIPFGVAIRWTENASHRGFLAVRHPRYVGLVFEAVGVAAIVGAPVTVALACFGLPLLLLVAANIEEELREVSSEADRHSVYSARAWRSVTMIRLSVDLLPVSLVTCAIGLGIAFAVGDIRIYSSNPPTGQAILLAFAGAQASLLLFVASALLIGLQFLASSLSWRATRHLLYRYRLLAAAVLVITSVTYDLIIVFRTDDWLVDRGRAGVLLDESFALAAVAVAFLCWSVASLAPFFTAESLMNVLMKRLDTRWSRWVVSSWNSEKFAPDPNDPFLPIVDVLRGLLASNDDAGMRTCISGLARTLGDMWPPGPTALSLERTPAKDWPAGTKQSDVAKFDEYLHSHMTGLIRQAAGRSDEADIGRLYELIRYLYQEAHPYPSVERHFLISFDEAPCEMLMREIVSSCDRAGKLETSSDGLRMIGFAGTKLVRLLPAVEELSFPFNRAYDYERRRSDDEKKIERQNDAKMRIVLDIYIRYLEGAGYKAAGRGHGQVCDTAIWELHTFAATTHESEEVESFVRRSALAGAERVIGEAIRKGVEGVSLLPYTMSLTGDDTKPQSVSDWCAHLARVLRRMRLAGVLDAYAVKEAGDWAIFALRTRKASIETLFEEFEIIASRETPETEDPLQTARDEAKSALDTLRRLMSG